MIINPVLLAVPMVEASVVRAAAFHEAKSLVTNKGIVNIGSTGNRISPFYVFTYMVGHDELVVANVDFRNHSGFSNFTEQDLEQPLLYARKQFDVAFCSHTLEHIEHWQQLLSEMDRVADHIIIVLPHFLLLSSWIQGDHKNHFLPPDVALMECQYLNLRIYW